MCIASPGRVKSLKGNLAEVDFGGLTRTADATLVPALKKGDYVFVHAGFIITILERGDALERMKLIKEVGLD